MSGSIAGAALLVALIEAAVPAAVGAPGPEAADHDPPPVTDGLILDLDADRDVTVTGGDRVIRWENQVPDAEARAFVRRDEGREKPGSGRPTLKRKVAVIDGHSSLVFRRQELVNMREDVFDHLITGSGYTWFCVLAPFPQREGLADVNSFFGNLRNGGNFEGFWGNLNDDNAVWIGSRNGVTFGRFDENNPKLLGPRLETGAYHAVAGRMAAGTGTVPIELFVGDAEPTGSVPFPVDPEADPSRMAIGQERDAVEHPGRESFDGAMTRFLVYERPLSRREMERVFEFLAETYDMHTP